ncbi:hypothetical protein [Vibrio coralliilyticus]|uniref:hypothetical protein n=1 Tax=Vibrio coralliilyticus TaxID=190893 RepID=UPI000BAB218D|nr:hypothetical protein [Vibrio coralliilyticus]NOI58345.1 hypothetical protein [Vibrio coralliilyticus]PAT67511.1 hypothetical protein CKA27_14570 [Vibrio coralliilyticus]
MIVKASASALVFFMLNFHALSILTVASFCQSSAILIKELAAIADTGIKIAVYSVNPKDTGC